MRKEKGREIEKRLRREKQGREKGDEAKGGGEGRISVQQPATLS